MPVNLTCEPILMRRHLARCMIVALVLAAVGPASLAWAEEPGRGPATLERPAAGAIAPEDALDHVGKDRTVEFVVAAARKLDDKEVCFLNSRRDYRESGNFTAVIFRMGLARYAAEGVVDPADEFFGKTIRVSGLVEERNGQAQIVVDSPTQIRVVTEDKPVSPEARDR